MKREEVSQSLTLTLECMKGMESNFTEFFFLSRNHRMKGAQFGCEEEDHGGGGGGGVKNTS